MGLLRLTVTSKNGKTDYAGTVLFNSDYIMNARTYNAATNNTYFNYRKMEDDSVPDEYIVSDMLSTVVGAYAAPAVGKSTTYQETFSIATFRDDIGDSTSSTTNRVIDLRDIVKGIALPSDTTQSILWISKGPRNVKKFLVDKFLKAFEDLWTTGTTTTYE